MPASSLPTSEQVPRTGGDLSEAIRRLSLTVNERDASLGINDETLLRSSLAALGFALVEAISDDPGHHEYEVTTPRTLYAPWKGDDEFIAAYEKVSGSTLVDRGRCYELWSLVEQMAKLRGGTIIEVGVWKGGTGALLARKAQLCGLSEGVYLCDTFRGVVKAGLLDPYYRGGEHADATVGQVEALLRVVGVDSGVHILEGVFPEEIAGRIADKTFRLCHVDVDVYRSAKDAVEWLWDRVVPGGIVVLDDYGCRNCGGVSRYVEEELRHLPDRLFVFNTNGHGLLIKR